MIVCTMGESADMSGECGSRTNLEMPDVQHELLAELVKLGKPVVLLNLQVDQLYSLGKTECTSHHERMVWRLRDGRCTLRCAFRR